MSVTGGLAHLWFHKHHCNDTFGKGHGLNMADDLRPQGISGHLHKNERSKAVQAQGIGTADDLAPCATYAWMDFVTLLGTHLLVYQLSIHLLVWGDMNHSLGLIARDMRRYGISYGNLFPVDVGQQALWPPYSPLDASIPVWVTDPAMVSSGLHIESLWPRNEVTPVTAACTVEYKELPAWVTLVATVLTAVERASRKLISWSCLSMDVYIMMGVWSFKSSRPISSTQESLLLEAILENLLSPNA